MRTGPAWAPTARSSPLRSVACPRPRAVAARGRGRHLGGDRERSLRREPPDQLTARVDVELAVDPAEMELDGLVAEEQGRGDFLVRPSLGDPEGDLQLLRRQPLALARRPSPEPFAAGAQLGARAIFPRRGAESLERLERCPELPARHDAPAGPTETLAEAELRASPPEDVVVLRVELERPAKVALELLLARDEPGAPRREDLGEAQA